MEYQPRPDLQQYRLNVMQRPTNAGPTKPTNLVLYYDPTAHSYWEPNKNVHYSTDEVFGIMDKALLKLTFRFDSAFPT
jgi:hypothetical protein